MTYSAIKETLKFYKRAGFSPFTNEFDYRFVNARNLRSVRPILFVATIFSSGTAVLLNQYKLEKDIKCVK